MGVGKWKRETGNWDLRVALDFGGDAGARFRPGGRRERLEIGKGKRESGNWGLRGALEFGGDAGAGGLGHAGDVSQLEIGKGKMEIGKREAMTDGWLGCVMRRVEGGILQGLKPLFPAAWLSWLKPRPAEEGAHPAKRRVRHSSRTKNGGRMPALPNATRAPGSSGWRGFRG
jgi:hypothetical protein